MVHHQIKKYLGPKLPVGPNVAIKPKLPTSHKPGPPRPTPSQPTLRPTPKAVAQATPCRQPDPPLFNLTTGAYAALNSSQGNLTQSCWLCLSASPPYYEGTASRGSPRMVNSSSCDWSGGHKLTLPEVSGKGLRIGSPPAEVSKTLREQAITLNTSASQYWAPDPGTWWACSTGLTPCISTSIFNQSRDYCIMVHLYPRVLYHEADTFEELVESRTT